MLLSIIVGAAIFNNFDIDIQFSDTTERAQSDPTPVPVTIATERDLSTAAVKTFFKDNIATDPFADLLTWAEREGYLPNTGFAQIVNWAYGGASLPAELQPTGAAITYDNNASAEIVVADTVGLLKIGNAHNTPLIWLVHVSGTESAPVLHLVTSIQGAIIEGRYTSGAVKIYVDGVLTDQHTAHNGILLVTAHRRLSTCTTGATEEIVALMTTQAFFAGTTTAVAATTSAYFTLKGETQKGIMAATLAVSTSASVVLMTDFDALAAALEDNPPTFRASDPDSNGQWFYFCSDDARQVMRAPYYQYQIAAQDDRKPPPEICADPACTMIEGYGSADFLLHANSTQTFTIKDCGGNMITGRIDKQTDRIQVYEHCAGQTCIESSDRARCEDSASPPDTSDTGSNDAPAEASYTGTLAFAPGTNPEEFGGRIDSSSIALTIPQDGGRVTGSLSFTVSQIFDPLCEERDVISVETFDFKGTYNQTAGTMMGTFSGQMTGKSFTFNDGCRIGDRQTVPMGVSHWSATVSSNSVNGEIWIVWREGDDPVQAFTFQLDAPR